MCSCVARECTRGYWLGCIIAKWNFNIFGINRIMSNSWSLYCFFFEIQDRLKDHFLSKYIKNLSVCCMDAFCCHIAFFCLVFWCCYWLLLLIFDTLSIFLCCVTFVFNTQSNFIDKEQQQQHHHPYINIFLYTLTVIRWFEIGWLIIFHPNVRLIALSIYTNTCTLLYFALTRVEPSIERSFSHLFAFFA